MLNMFKRNLEFWKWLNGNVGHPAGTSVSSVKYDKPVHSASHYGQWGHFFVACVQTNSVENPWISQSSLDLFPKWF